MKESVNTIPAFSAPLLKRMIIGASVALVLISWFLSGVDRPDPAWPQYWMIKPLIIVPLAGAAGGFCFHLLDFIRRRGLWQKVIANLLGIIIYVIGLWIGTVLGLNGTLWN